jgi:hypothetical protein
VAIALHTHAERHSPAQHITSQHVTSHTTPQSVITTRDTSPHVIRHLITTNARLKSSEWASRLRHPHLSTADTRPDFSGFATTLSTAPYTGSVTLGTVALSTMQF